MPNQLIQQTLADRMRPAVMAGRIGHALLFSGPEGSGKRELAEWLTSALLCENRDKAPCGVCPGCRKVLSGNHADVLTVRRESGRKAVTVSAVEEIQSFLANKAYEGGNRVVRIEEAHLLNEQAQNKLLKTLEEPPENVTLILLADRVDPLLPTVLSRCRTVRMERMAESEIKRRLLESGVGRDKAEHAARSADGWYGNALRKTEDTEYWQDRDVALEVLLEVGQPGGSVRSTALLAPLRSRWTGLFPLWQGLLRDAVLGETGEMLHPDKKKEICLLRERFSRTRLETMWRCSHEAEKRTAENANAQLVIDWLLSMWEGRD